MVGSRSPYADFSYLLFYCESRWLSRGNVLKCVFELREELFQYLTKENHPSAPMFSDTDFLLKLAYLTDIFEKLNILNSSLQGVDCNIIQHNEKLNSFIKKIDLWQRKLGAKQLDMFRHLKEFTVSNQLTLGEEVRSCILDHLSSLKKHFENYFPDLEIKNYDWIKDPFNSEPKDNVLTISEEEQFIDIVSESALKNRFTTMTLPQFWISLSSEHREISEKALKILLPFTTSYLCETGFSAVAVIKSKYRSKINVEREMRLAISKIQPRFEKLCRSKQAHPTH